MSMIKLTLCFLKESDKLKNPANNIYWFEWTTCPVYINPDYIIHISKCSEYEGQGKDYILNDPNFNTKIEINQINKSINEYVKETPEQIIKLIDKTK